MKESFRIIKIRTLFERIICSNNIINLAIYFYHPRKNRKSEYMIDKKMREAR